MYSRSIATSRRAARMPWFVRGSGSVSCSLVRIRCSRRHFRGAELLLGPFVGTIVMQWYIFITTGSLVRAQAIITQLVFEHSLRIRMKAETAASTPSPSTAVTPDTASLADTAVGTEGTEGGHSAEGTEQTLLPSSASVTSSTSGKGKGKAKDEDDDKKDKDGNLVGKINNLVCISTLKCLNLALTYPLRSPLTSRTLSRAVTSCCSVSSFDYAHYALSHSCPQFCTRPFSAPSACTSCTCCSAGVLSLAWLSWSFVSHFPAGSRARCKPFRRQQ